jgi:hypothetical protein
MKQRLGTVAVIIAASNHLQSPVQVYWSALIHNNKSQATAAAASQGGVTADAFVQKAPADF